MQATSTDCPSCGYSLAHTDVVLASACPEGLSDLRDRVRSLDALISQLNQEKANALRKINTILDKTRHLPFEVLSRIFQLVRPPIDFRDHIPDGGDQWETECQYLQRDTFHREEDYHFKLAGVSYRWRQIVLSTPQLWTTISLGIWMASTKSAIPLLDLYSQRAGDLGISVELDFRFHAVWRRENGDKDAREMSLTLLQPLFEVVHTKIAPKLRHLTLIAPPSEILSNMGKNFSLCSSLTLYGVGLHEWPEPTIVVELPRLQCVLLHRIDSPVVLPWLSITHMEFESMPASAVFDALTKCLNLVKFRNSGGGHSHSNIDHTETIIHEKLESMFCDDDVDLFRHFRFTRLRTLHWGNIDDHYTYSDPRIRIFSNLPSTLVSLTLGQMSLSPNHLEALLLCLPQLLELRLFRCKKGAIERAMQRIGRPSRSNASTIVGPTILPNLRSLSILTYERVDSRMVVDMLEVLSSVGRRGESFHLELSKSAWHEAASQRLQALVSSGFNVELKIADATIPSDYGRDFPWW